MRINTVDTLIKEFREGRINFSVKSVELFVREVVNLRSKLEREKRLRELYPRAFKLMDKGKYFVVVAFDEPYFMKVYAMIREQEIKIGRWTEEDEKVYQFFQKEDE